MKALTDHELARMLNALDRGYTPMVTFAAGQGLTQNRAQDLLDELVRRGQAKTIAGCYTLA